MPKLRTDKGPYARAGTRVPPELLHTAIAWETMRETYLIKHDRTEEAIDAVRIRRWLEERIVNEDPMGQSISA